MDWARPHWTHKARAAAFGPCEEQQGAERVGDGGRPLPLVAGRTPALWTSCLPAFWKAPWGAYPCAGPGDPVASLASQLYRSPSLGEGLLVPPGPGCSHAPWLLPSLGGRPLACCLR